MLLQSTGRKIIKLKFAKTIYALSFFFLKNFFVVEFESVSSVSLALSSFCHHRQSHSSSIPVYSPFLWLTGKTATRATRGKKTSGEKNPSDERIPVYLPVIQEGPALTDKEVLSKVEEKRTVRNICSHTGTVGMVILNKDATIIAVV